MDLYREEILDHYKNPRNFGKLKSATHKARETNASCGDVVEVFLKVRNVNSKGKIEDVKFRAEGCALSIASASMLSERIMKQEIGIKELLRYTEKDVALMLGIDVSPGRLSCVMLPVQAVQRAIDGES